jgi:hypothetical protein
MLATPTRPQRRPAESRADDPSSAAWQVTLVTMLMAALSLAVTVCAVAIKFLA